MTNVNTEHCLSSNFCGETQQLLKERRWVLWARSVCWGEPHRFALETQGIVLLTAGRFAADSTARSFLRNCPSAEGDAFPNSYHPPGEETPCKDCLLEIGNYENLVPLSQFGAPMKGHEVHRSLRIGNHIILQLLCPLLLPSILITSLPHYSPGRAQYLTCVQIAVSDSVLGASYLWQTLSFVIPEQKLWTCWDIQFHFPLLYWGYKDKSFSEIRHTYQRNQIARFLNEESLRGFLCGRCTAYFSLLCLRTVENSQCVLIQSAS